MNTKLTNEQKQELDELVEHTLSALCDICILDMSDVDENDEEYLDKDEDRTHALFVEAINYFKNNLH